MPKAEASLRALRARDECLSSLRSKLNLLDLHRWVTACQGQTSQFQSSHARCARSPNTSIRSDVRNYCRRKQIMECVRKPREKLCARARSTPPKREKPARKVGGEAAHFWCPFFEFWKGGTRSRIVFREAFARRPLSLSDDNDASSTSITRYQWLWTIIGGQNM